MKDLPKAIISDLDGTIALLKGRDPYSPKTIINDGLNKPVADILKIYNKYSDVSLFIVSGRSDRYKNETEKWLKKYDLDFYKDLIMRPDTDKRKDFVLKNEMYETHIKGKYNVIFVMDDRDQTVKLWRGLGLTCLQVAEGNF